MDSFDKFRKWLDENTEYTKPTKSNIVSRLKRANNICQITNDPVYFFNLSQAPEFQVLTVSVKSQLRRAVKIYIQYIEGEQQGGENVEKSN